METIDDYVIIVVYPDGRIEKIMKDDREFHMEYMVDLINHSEGLTRIAKENDVFIPDDEFEIKFSVTYTLDAELAKAGVITFHNLIIDLDVVSKINDWKKLFYITLPNELSDSQKQILNDITSNYDFSECWFGVYRNNVIENIEYDELLGMIKNKTKKAIR